VDEQIVVKMRKTLYVWAAVGAIVPVAFLIDLNLLSGVLSDDSRLLLLLWPSSFMLSGFTTVNFAVVVGLVMSVALNIVLYGLVGLLSSHAYAFLTSRGRQY
jgi:hypothetical protein